MASPTGNSGFNPALMQQQMQLMMQMQQQMADMQKQLSDQNTTIQTLTQAGPSAQQKSALLTAQLNIVSEEEKEIRSRINSLQASITRLTAELSTMPKFPNGSLKRPADQKPYNDLNTQRIMETQQLEEAKKMLAELSKKRADIEAQIKTFTQ